MPNTPRNLINYSRGVSEILGGPGGAGGYSPNPPDFPNSSLSRHRRWQGENSGRTLFERVFFQVQHLAQVVQNKKRVVNQVTVPKSTRLLPQPEKPFQAAVLHPARGLGYSPGEEIKGGPNPNQYRRGQVSTMRCHPQILFGRAQPHPHNVRLSLVDTLYCLRIFAGGEGSKGWRPATGYLQSWKTTLQGGS